MKKLLLITSFMVVGASVFCSDNKEPVSGQKGFLEGFMKIFRSASENKEEDNRFLPSNDDLNPIGKEGSIREDIKGYYRSKKEAIKINVVKKYPLEATATLGALCLLIPFISLKSKAFLGLGMFSGAACMIRVYDEEAYNKIKSGIIEIKNKMRK